MIFQILDNKIECRGVYLNNQILNEPPEGLTATWGYSANLPLDVEYAKFYCNKELDEVCPERIKDKWEKVSQKLKAHLKSFITAKIDLTEHCFYDLVPEQFLREYCELKNEITQHVLDTYEKPEDYDYLLSLAKVVEDIKKQNIRLDLHALSEQMANQQTRTFVRKIRTLDKRVKYNIYGTKTGRLTTEPGSFPILTMKKEYRAAILPNNDLFMEIDYNAAELRTLLALSDKEQPKEDIHEWNIKNVYRGLVTRQEAKERIFAWLYNPASKDYLSNRAYERDKVLEKYWDGKEVKTIFNKVIPSDRHHALNYIIQSTTAEMFLKQMVKVHEILKEKKSFIAFSVHDSLVIDLAKEDKELIPELIKVFEETPIGNFKANLSLGKSYGKMRKV